MWTREGNLVIPDPVKLERKLPLYFRHQHYSSFQRQLNNFGFHKKRKPTACLSGTAAQPRKGAAYDHPLLVGQQPEAVRDRRLFYGGGSRRWRRGGREGAAEQARRRGRGGRRCRAGDARRVIMRPRQADWRRAARPPRYRGRLRPRMNNR